MSLVLFVSSKKVIISKYQLEFTFSQPPGNLTKAAIGAYQLLRQSESIQIDSTRVEKEEAITLLKEYGLALFHAVIPARYRSYIADAGGLFIYTLDSAINNLPWELLFDGSSFLALTQGVVRINETDAKQSVHLAQEPISSLEISLNAYSALDCRPPGARFVCSVEELASSGVSSSPRINLSVNGDASFETIETLNQFSPDIFLFSGHDSDKGWLLKKDPGAFDEDYLNYNQITSAFEKSVKKRLRILILHASSLIKDPARSAVDPLRRFFDLGTPFIISIHGRIARERLKEYFQSFIYRLTREESILRAHRHAINVVQSSLALSWDWSWIRLQLNKLLLEQQSGEPPLPPFRFLDDDRQQRSETPATNYKNISLRKFYGAGATFRRLNDALTNGNNREAVCLRTSEGMPIEDYLNEFVRRRLSLKSLSYSCIYYQRWGYHSGQVTKLARTQLFKLFSTILAEKNVAAYFEKSKIDLAAAEIDKEDLKLLAVYHPPNRLDQAFDDWLRDKRQNGWRILFLSNEAPVTKLSLMNIDCDDVEARCIHQAFEDELPESWIDLMVDPLPPQMKNLMLLETISNYNNEKFIKLITKEQNPKVLWYAIFHEIFSSLSSQQLKIFLALFLAKVRCAKEDLRALFPGRKFDDDLNKLRHLRLIDSDITDAMYWVPINYQCQLRKFNLAPKKQIQSIGPELLQRQIVALQDSQIPRPIQMIAFQNCVYELAIVDSVENSLQRNLQYGKKIVRNFRQSPDLFYPIIHSSLEMSLISRKKLLLNKTLFSVLGILENLPFQDDVIHIYEWLMQSEKKQRNWAMVSEVMMKLAKVYAGINRKEKAISLITAALQLNNDIKNYSKRYHCLISIALLLLDLGEYEKVRKVVGSAEFDLKRLNDEDMVKLWLIDGHLLYQDEKFDEAAKSFLKTFNKAKPSVPENLLAKTYLNLAQIFYQRDDIERYEESLKKAVQFFDMAGNQTDAIILHERLADLLLSSGKPEIAITHLEWLFNAFQQAGDIDRARDLADQLGGLYYKVGDKSKSTSYYSIAQGI